MFRKAMLVVAGPGLGNLGLLFPYQGSFSSILLLVIVAKH